MKKRVVMLMGLIALLSSLFGCTKGPRTGGETDIDGPDIGNEIIENGDDFSQTGSGEYKKVVGLEFGINGYREGASYFIHKDENDATKTILEYENPENSVRELSCEVCADTMEKLSKLCADLNILSWDKFNKSMKNVLDGSGFYLTVSFEDGTHINAQGSNSFPKNYSQFEKGLAEVMEPVINAEIDKQKEDLYNSGAYSSRLEMAMINYSGRGKSGSDSYSFLIRNYDTNSSNADMKVKSVSGEFIEPGDYRYYGTPDNIDELLAEIQTVLEKYSVYKWDGYDESTPDYNDREWFQLNFYYADAQIGCCGCGDTENYAEVRKEILEIVNRYMKEYLAEENK